MPNKITVEQLALQKETTDIISAAVEGLTCFGYLVEHIDFTYNADAPIASLEGTTLLISSMKLSEKRMASNSFNELVSTAVIISATDYIKQCV